MSWWAVGDADLLRAAIEVETARRKLEAARLGRGEAQRCVQLAEYAPGVRDALAAGTIGGVTQW